MTPQERKKNRPLKKKRKKYAYLCPPGRSGVYTKNHEKRKSARVSGVPMNKKKMKKKKKTQERRDRWCNSSRGREKNDVWKVARINARARTVMRGVSLWGEVGPPPCSLPP